MERNRIVDLEIWEMDSQGAIENPGTKYQVYESCGFLYPRILREKQSLLGKKV
jgi:hypothetical protein